MPASQSQFLLAVFTQSLLVMRVQHQHCTAPSLGICIFATNVRFRLFGKHFWSGNVATSHLLGRLATSVGYKRNAAWLYPLMIAHLSSLQQPKRGDWGILLMDFAGIDVIFVSRMHSTPLKVEEKAIIDAIIKCNF